jgi:hypothetical protein
VCCSTSSTKSSSTLGAKPGWPLSPNCVKNAAVRASDGGPAALLSEMSAMLAVVM